MVNDELRSDGNGESKAVALDDWSNDQYLLGSVLENGTPTNDGTPDMSTNVLHGHVENGEKGPATVRGQRGRGRWFPEDRRRGAARRHQRRW